MKKDVGMALCQKPLKLAECRNVCTLTGHGRWPKTTYTPPIPTSFFKYFLCSMWDDKLQLNSIQTGSHIT